MTLKRNQLVPNILAYCRSLFDPQFVPTAIKVALVVGSVLFAINHGAALLGGRMNQTRWISGGLTYLVPYCVNVHGQYIGCKQLRKHKQKNNLANKKR